MQPSYPLPPIRLLHIHRDGVQQYKASIDQHAEVHWDGIAWVKVKGRRLWALPHAKLEALRQCLEKYDFLHVDDKKEGEFFLIHTDPDLGKFKLTVVFADGTSKTLVHDHNFREDSPKALWQLERSVETILGVRKYAGPPPMIE